MPRVLGLVILTVFACSDGSKDSNTGQPIAGATGSNAGSGAGGSGGGQTPQGGAGGSQSSQGGSNPGSSTVSLPRVYPPVRAATPTALIANPNNTALPFRSEDQQAFGTARQAQTAINLATAIQERFYSTGPTDLLRIVKGLDDRVQGLDLSVAAHPCLSTPPVAHTYVLPAGQSFQVKLQCMQRFGTPGMSSGWVGFGRVPSSGAEVGEGTTVVDASVPTDGGSGELDAGRAPTDGSDFYLVEGQEGGNGGAYHIDQNGNVEGWVAVAERDIPANSQVIMHLLTKNAPKTLELALAGSAVGFCAAHLKTNPTFLFVSGKTNAPPPPGTMQAVGTQYCDEPRSGCFAADNLATDLGSDSPSCDAISPSSFDVAVSLDSDTTADAGVNVVTSEIHSYFSQMPVGVPDF